jgi:phenylacetate-CoA ligase
MDRLDHRAIVALQGDRLHALLTEVLPHNDFYARKFAAAGVDPATIQSPADLARLPFTTKAELLANQAAYPPYGRTLTYPLTHYCRMNQTSGTLGRPLRWLDTAESWRWLIGCWEMIYRIAGVRPDDRLFFPFSFGPFLGFWTAFDAAVHLGYLSLPGGGMSSTARLRFLLDNEATVVLCTPTYALRLAEVAAQEGIDLAGSSVRALIVAGEPGGSIPATRARIETAWGARVFDHNGLTEVGAVGVECPQNPAGLHILETEYVAEVIDPESRQASTPGEIGELVLTNLGRWGSPVIRYRTGDLVRTDTRPCPCRRSLIRLEGGILGRADDMIHVRGNKLYPTALEAVLRRIPEVAEYRVEIDRSGPLVGLRIEVEPTTAAGGDLAARVSRAIGDELLFRAEVAVVSPGSLPRYEMKSRRISVCSALPSPLGGEGSAEHGSNTLTKENKV